MDYGFGNIRDSLICESLSILQESKNKGIIRDEWKYLAEIEGKEYWQWINIQINSVIDEIIKRFTLKYLGYELRFECQCQGRTK